MKQIKIYYKGETTIIKNVDDLFQYFYETYALYVRCSGDFYLSNVPQDELYKDPELYLHGTKCYKIEQIDRNFIITSLSRTQDIDIYHVCDDGLFDYLISLGVDQWYVHSLYYEFDNDTIVGRYPMITLPNVQTAMEYEFLYR